MRPLLVTLGAITGLLIGSGSFGIMLATTPHAWWSALFLSVALGATVTIAAGSLAARP